MDLHIDDFCQDVARVLINLHACFPLKHAVYVEDISGPDEPDEVGLHSPRFSACLGAMLWLAEEGWIRYDTLIYQEGIDQAVLTQKAFLVLSAQSDVLYADIPDQPLLVKQQKATRIEQLRTAIKSKKSSQINDMVHYLLSAAPTLILPPEPALPEEPSDH